MKIDLTPLLSCPVCHGKLRWTVRERNGDHIEKAEARCRKEPSYSTHRGRAIKRAYHKNTKNKDLPHTLETEPRAFGVYH